MEKTDISQGDPNSWPNPPSERYT